MQKGKVGGGGKKGREGEERGETRPCDTVPFQSFLLALPYRRGKKPGKKGREKGKKRGGEGRKEEKKKAEYYEYDPQLSAFFSQPLGCLGKRKGKREQRREGRKKGRKEKGRECQHE